MIQNVRDDTVGFRLPSAAYLEKSWWRHEQERIFDRSWSLVAAREELAHVGAAVDVRVGRYELVVVRTSSGLRAFHNVCRHRGMALVGGPTTLEGNFRCPYHGWEFDTSDGSITRLPQRASQFETVDLNRLGLLPASVAEWEGMIFAHPDAAATPFTEVVAEFAAGIGSFQPGLLAQIAHVEINVDFNWKLFVENHVDVYHLWYLHSETLGQFDHTRFEYRHVGPNWISYEPRRRDAPRQSSGIAPITHIAERDRDGIGAHLLFPNVTMASTNDYFVTYAVHPTGPTTSRIDVRVRAEDPADSNAVVAAVRSFIDEDIVACKGVQRAMATPGFQVGPLARTHERPIVRFHDELLDRLDVAAVPLPTRHEEPA